MDSKLGNLLTPLPPAGEREQVELLARGSSVRIERIVSAGQASPPGFWYDQAWHEWVVLLQGSAVLRFADRAAPLVMAPGDYVAIAAHRRHRVEATDPGGPTVWLAVHYR
ncbi:MAG: cupin domain-containing protein [Alphaproteobacteria bacterium]